MCAIVVVYYYNLAYLFLTRFLSSCCSIKMADIPLVFVTFALSELSPQPVLGAEALAVIRYSSSVRGLWSAVEDVLDREGAGTDQ